MKQAELQSILSEVEAVRQRFGNLPLYRVEPEWDSSGIWLPKMIGSVALGPNLILEDFPISIRTKARLESWQNVFDDQVPERLWEAAGSHAWWSGEGLNVAIEISRELGEEALVEYAVGECGLLFRNGGCIATYPLDPTTSGLWEGPDD